jgi:hypothetical protein
VGFPTPVINEGAKILLFFLVYEVVRKKIFHAPYPSKIVFLNKVKEC